MSELPDLFLDAAAGDAEARRIARAVKVWLSASASATRETAPICLSCDESAFCGGLRPAALVLILPVDNAGEAYATGICESCDADNITLMHRTVARLNERAPGTVTVLPAHGHC
jgi:hypothetical protein